jgi:hypothetical protein
VRSVAGKERFVREQQRTLGSQRRSSRGPQLTEIDESLLHCCPIALKRRKGRSGVLHGKTSASIGPHGRPSGRYLAYPKKVY